MNASREYQGTDWTTEETTSSVRTKRLERLDREEHDSIIGDYTFFTAIAGVFNAIVRILLNVTK